MSIFEKKISPIRQALMVFGASCLMMLGGWAVKKAGIFETEKLFSWAIATAFLLLFGILNSIFSLNATNRLKYWRDSMYAYLVLAVLNGLVAWQISGVRVSDAESYKFIYLVVTIGFVVFITMVNAMRSIVEFAQREEWNQPRKRK